MANFNKQPNKTQAGTNIQEVRQQNAQSAQAGQFGTEFASEFASSKAAQASQSAGQFGTEFASETNAAEVKQQNQQAEARKNQNVGKFGQNK
jgi:small acid-soluble spore protein E (minor gamma-type SASP)